METDLQRGSAAAAAPVKPIGKPSRHRSIQKKPHTETRKLQRRVRHSFESGRPDHLDIAGANGPGATSGAHFPVGYFYAAAGNNPPLDASSYNPTLRHPSKRNGQHLQRIKGSKRRKNADDAEREAELKAISKEAIYNHSKNLSFTPLRPAAEEWTAGRPLKKETVKAHHSFSGRHGRNKRHSDVSIPAAESIDSAMSSDSEQIAYTVSPFSALAPKPTLRYALHSSGPPSGGLVPRRLPSQRRKMAQPIPEAVLKAHKRVDDLADNLDASDLRELMERDQRRRERRRLREQERAQQRLRQAERQRDHPDEDYAESSTPANLARGVLGRESADMGAADSTSAVVTSSTRRESPQRPISPPASPGLHPPLDSDASAISVIEEHGSASLSAHERSARISRRRSPVEVFYRPDSSPAPPASDFEAGPSSTKTGENLSSSTPVLPERTNSKLRKLVKLRRRLSAGSSLQDPERVSKMGRSSSRKTSDTSSFRGAFSWGALGSIFRRKHKGKHGSGPSSFSNLSRDSMAGQAGPRSQAQVHFHWQQPSQSNSILVIQTQPPVAGSGSASTPEKQHGAHPFKVHSGVPQRTLSRFREDLPDFLMSPPRSREPSTEPEAVPPVPKPVSVSDVAAAVSQTQYFDEEEEEGQEDEREEEEEEHDISSTVQGTQGTGEEHQGSMRGGKAARESMRDTPTSWLQMDTASPSPEPNQAMSLASIDSEGSWLSGRISKRPISGQDSARVINSLDDVTHKSLRTGHYRYSRRSWASNETGVSSELATSPVSARFTAVSGTSEVAMADDEYVHRAVRDSVGASSASSSTFHRESSLGEMRSSSAEDETARWGAVSHHKTTTVVTAPLSSMRSNEVLKSFYEGEDEDMDSPLSRTSPISQISQDSSEFKEEEAGLQRATSVNLGKGHVRKISAGSAKLLEISPRSSVDAKDHVDTLL